MGYKTFHPEDCSPHTDVRTCSRCRKKFEKGHRVIQVHIFESASLNPRNLGNTGAMLYEEFELMHADCHDPFLKRGVNTK